MAFLVPGLIALHVRAQFLTGRTPPASEALLTFLVLSVVYYALIFPLVELILNLEGPPYKKAFAWFALVFLGPVLFGGVLGWVAQKNVSRRLLMRLGFRVVHGIPTAWDYVFGRGESCWVLVVLNDDTKFAGWFGSESFASSSTGERDIYIKHAYDVGGDDKWAPTNRSVLIKGSTIKTIEFWPKNNEGE